jgi:CRP/FNR family cyclic AMP-dependent transcriptional regulator
MANAEELSQVALFDGISIEQCARIADIAEEKHFSQGELIFREGDRAEHIYVLLDGKVTIRVHLTSRPESLTVSVINQVHQSFGWSGVVSPYHFTASALCETACQVYAIPGQQLMDILKDDPESGFQVMCKISELISNRLRSSRQVLLKSL